jgi:hypothetical protein
MIGQIRDAASVPVKGLGFYAVYHISHPWPVPCVIREPSIRAACLEGVTFDRFTWPWLQVHVRFGSEALDWPSLLI